MKTSRMCAAPSCSTFRGICWRPSRQGDMGYEEWLGELHQSLNKLPMRKIPLTGCLRKNRLTENETPTWRDVRADALLSVLGARQVFPGPNNTPPWEAYVRAPYLITFRGGNWKEWWQKDLEVLAALARSIGLHGVVVLHEFAGALNIVYIQCPADHLALIEKAVSEWQRSDRINKSSPQGRAWCRFCPVSSACMQIDLERGQTDDWPNPPR